LYAECVFTPKVLWEKCPKVLWEKGPTAAVSKLALIYSYIDASIFSEVLQWPKKMSGRLSQAAKRRSC
jgi:hypothetical protein